MKQDSRNLLGIWEIGNWGDLPWTSKTFWELGIRELKEFTDIDPLRMHFRRSTRSGGRLKVKSSNALKCILSPNFSD